MKRTVFALLIIILVNISCGSKVEDSSESVESANKNNVLESVNLLIVTESWPPYVYEDNGEIKGFDYEVVINVFKIMNKPVKCEFYPWKRCIEMIKKNRATAILDAGLNEDRKKFMIFPAEKLSDSNSVLFYLKGKQKEVNSIQDLTGKIVGVSRGYKYSNEFNNATNFKKEPVDTFDLNPKKLLNERIDYFIHNRSVALFKMKGTEYESKITYVKKPITFGANYLAFSMKEGNEELAKEFSRELKKFKQTTEYKKIMQKYGQ